MLFIVVDSINNSTRGTIDLDLVVEAHGSQLGG